MEIRSLLTPLLRRWWLIAIPVAIGIAAALPALLNRTATSGGFTASLRYTAAPAFQAFARPSGDYQDLWIAAQYTVDAFTDWVRGNQFADAVIAEANRAGAGAAPGSLRVAADSEDSLGQLIMSHENAETLAALQTAAERVLAAESAGVFGALAGTPARVSIIDRSPVTAAPPPLTDRFGPLLRVGLAFLVGIGLALLAHYFDRRVRERRELEQDGLRVLATIPRP